MHALTRGIAVLALSAAWPASGRAADVVQGCDRFVDRTAPGADRQLSWGFSIASDPERCIEIVAGQQVRWVGSFGAHPLDADGGDVPNPIARHDEGLVTFCTPGTFGFVCGFHPVMKGAVRVVAPASPVPAVGLTGLAALPALFALGWWLSARRSRRVPT